MPTLVELHPTAAVVVRCAWLYICCHLPPHTRWVSDIQYSYRTWHTYILLAFNWGGPHLAVGFYRLVSCFSVVITPLLVKYAYNEWVVLTRSIWSCISTSSYLVCITVPVVCVASEWNSTYVCIIICTYVHVIPSHSCAVHGRLVIAVLHALLPCSCCL